MVVGNITGFASHFCRISVSIHPNAHNHLRQLKDCYTHGDWTWDSNFEGLEWKEKRMLAKYCSGSLLKGYKQTYLQSIVSIHKRMDQVIHNDKPSCWSNVVGIRIPGVQKDGAVMIPVGHAST